MYASSRSINNTPTTQSDSLTLAGILAQRGFTLAGRSTPLQSAHMCGLILKYLQPYNLQRKHWFHNAKSAGAPLSQTAPRLYQALLDKAWIKTLGGSRIALNAMDSEVKKFLNGVWLEECVWHAMHNHGADEVMLGQQIRWQLNGVQGDNEIDVIARHASALTFISCKTREPMDSIRATDELSKQIYEVAYWKQHFLQGHDKAVLATTLDMVDEPKGHRERVPVVRARGAVLGVEVWGYEDLLKLIQ